MQQNNDYSGLKTPMMRCEVCNADVEADLACHGPSVAVFILDCGHTMQCSANETSFTDGSGNVLLSRSVKPASETKKEIHPLIAKTDFSGAVLVVKSFAVGAILAAAYLIFV